MNGFRLTEVDRSILRELARDGRLPYKELAARVGLPVSTCHGRVRALEEAGAIRGLEPAVVLRHLLWMVRRGKTVEASVVILARRICEIAVLVDGAIVQASIFAGTEPIERARRAAALITRETS